MLNVFLLFANTFLRLLLFLAALIPQLLQKSRHLSAGSPTGPQGAGRSPSPTPHGGAFITKAPPFLYTLICTISPVVKIKIGDIKP